MLPLQFVYNATIRQMKDIKNFIVIDDDAINNKICQTIIEKIYTNVEVSTFTDPIMGFEYIVSEFASAKDDRPAVLFLDINMPVMDAWEFLNLFDKLDANLRNRITIYILSSSVNKVDMERAMSNRNVSYYLIKPLTKESIKLIANLAVRKKQTVPETAGPHMAAPPKAPDANIFNGSQRKREDEEREAKMKVIRLKNDLINRDIPELEKSINATLFEFEKKYKETGLFVEAITGDHHAFDKRKGGKLQLSFHFFDLDKDNNVVQL
jgi:CheY-like chemotaxis protein